MKNITHTGPTPSAGEPPEADGNDSLSRDSSLLAKERYCMLAPRLVVPGEADGGFYMLGLREHINHPGILNLVPIEAFQVAGQGARTARNIDDLFRLGFQESLDNRF